MGYAGFCEKSAAHRGGRINSGGVRVVKGLFWLIVAYSLSQFYRACLAVFAPALKAEIGLSAGQVSTALGAWFLVFAAMQIPVGWLLDNRSARKTAATILALGGGGGACVFAVAQGPWGIYAAMVLIGIGCSPVLMTSLYIFARSAPSNQFGTLAGLVVGIGSLGNLAASVPLSWAMSMIGWRAVCLVLAGLTVVVACALLKFVADPPVLEKNSETPSAGLVAVLKIRALYPILIMAGVAYAAPASLRGSWAGGYLSDVYGLGADGIGRVTFFMALAMIVGALTFGPMDRVIRSRKAIVLWGTALAAAFWFWLWIGAGTQSIFVTSIILIGIGFFGSAYGQIMNHGRGLLPVHLTGRGVTFINLFSIGGVGVFQFVTARVFDYNSVEAAPIAAPYAAVFGFFSILLVCGCVIYAFSREQKE
jgi:MFS family permease